LIDTREEELAPIDEKSGTIAKAELLNDAAEARELDPVPFTGDEISAEEAEFHDATSGAAHYPNWDTFFV